MWTKDQAIGQRPEEAFGLDTPFVLTAAEIAPETITTRLGEAEVAILRGHAMTAAGLGPERIAKTVASAIVNKVRLAEADDFPAVVELRRVNTKRASGALVIQYVAPWTGEVR